MSDDTAHPENQGDLKPGELKQRPTHTPDGKPIYRCSACQKKLTLVQHEWRCRCTTRRTSGSAREPGPTTAWPRTVPNLSSRLHLQVYYLLLTVDTTAMGSLLPVRLTVHPLSSSQYNSVFLRRIILPNGRIRDRNFKKR